jgi:hypothetical protein
MCTFQQKYPEVPSLQFDSQFFISVFLRSKAKLRDCHKYFLHFPVVSDIGNAKARKKNAFESEIN